MRSELFGAFHQSCGHSYGANLLCILIQKLIIFWFFPGSVRKWQCGSNSQRKLWNRFEFPDFFLVRAAALLTLRTLGAQINWRVISRKVLFDPQRFLSNKSPIHFARESGNGNTFLDGKWHVQNENGHRSPRSQTYAQQLSKSWPTLFLVTNYL
jgi:hypothetical protein